MGIVADRFALLSLNAQTEKNDTTSYMVPRCTTGKWSVSNQCNSEFVPVTLQSTDMSVPLDTQRTMEQQRQLLRWRYSQGKLNHSLNVVHFLTSPIYRWKTSTAASCKGFCFPWPPGIDGKVDPKLNIILQGRCRQGLLPFDQWTGKMTTARLWDHMPHPAHLSCLQTSVDLLQLPCFLMYNAHPQNWSNLEKVRCRTHTDVHRSDPTTDVR